MKRHALRSGWRPADRHPAIHRIPLRHHRAFRRALRRTGRNSLCDLRDMARPPHHAPSRNHPRNGRGEGSVCRRGSLRPLRSQYRAPADPGHHVTRARNSHPRRPRIQQSRDRGAAFCFREHRQDSLRPRLRQTRSRPPHPGRPARQRTRPLAMTVSPESTIFAAIPKNHPKG